MLGVKGLVAQTMDGRKSNPDPGQPPHIFPAGSWIFTPPRAGQWKFVAWGPGGHGGNGASGAYFEKTVSLSIVSTVQIVVGTPTLSDTTVTFPNGIVATAGRAAGSAVGVATGGDVNLAGSTSASVGLGTGGGRAGTGGAGAGSGAPANLPYRGGPGADIAAFSQANNSPGGGGTNDGIVPTPGGAGLVLAVFVRD